MLRGAFHFFDEIGVTKSIVVHRGRTLKVFGSNKFLQILYEVQSNAQTCMELFPDKLRDMIRYFYRIVLVEQIPNIILSVNGPLGINVMAMNEIAKAQKAQIGYGAVSEHGSIIDILETKRADLTLNTGLEMTPEGLKFFKPVNTYDEHGYCALIPIPPRLSFLNFLLSHLDQVTWILMFVSVAVCAIVWRLLRRNRGDSEWRFALSVLASFIGQGVDLKNNRQMQTMLFQLCLIMTFIIGNCYQSLTISSMMAAREGERISTFAELLNSDFNFKVDPILLDVMNNSGEYSAVVERMEEGDGMPDYEKLSQGNYAVIGRCDMVDYNYDIQTNEDVAKFYYKLPEKFMPFYEKILLSQDSPHHDKLQTMFDYVFESGIRQYFRHLLQIESLAKRQRDENFLKNEEFLLGFKDIHGVFIILTLGYAVSFAAVLCEIVWKKAKGKCSRKQDEKLFVRRRRVHPIEDEIEIDFCV
jgi:hypothetical protein